MGLPAHPHVWQRQRRRPVYGLVFLFKYQSAPQLASPPAAADDSRVFFAQQVIPNACATQVPPPSPQALQRSKG